EGGITDTAGAVFAGLAVAGLGADAPVADLALATEYEALDLLGLLAGFELASDFRIAQLTGQLRIGELGDQSLTHLVVLVAAVESAQPDFAVLIRAVVEVQAETGALAGDVVATLLNFLQPVAIIEVPGTAGFHVVRTELALLPAQGSGDAEVVYAITDAETVAEGAGDFRAVLAGVIVMAALGAEAIEQAVMVEGRQAFHLDGAAQGVGVHVRRQGLDHRQRLDQFAGHYVHGY